MATTFDFDIATDFPNGAVDLTVLTAELEGSTITADLVGVTLIASQPPGGIGDPPPPIDTCRIEWDTDLTPAEEITQATIVGDHQGVPFEDGVQRETVLPEQTNGSSDYADLVAAVLASDPLEAGEYTLSVSFELAVLNATAGSGAQAQVRFNGAEVALASSGLNVFDMRSASQPVAVQAGDTPTIDIRLRRVGAANTARIRRVRISLAPVMNGEEA